MAGAREEPQEGATRHISEGRGCGKWLQLGGEMEADDLLCSRNARPETGLVGRAQWKTIQPPSPQKEAPLLLCCRGGLASNCLTQLSRSDEGLGWLRVRLCLSPLC